MQPPHPAACGCRRSLCWAPEKLSEALTSGDFLRLPKQRCKQQVRGWSSPLLGKGIILPVFSLSHFCRNPQLHGNVAIPSCLSLLQGPPATGANLHLQSGQHSPLGAQQRESASAATGLHQLTRSGLSVLATGQSCRPSLCADTLREAGIQL